MAKAGRKPDEMRVKVRAIMPSEWSPRTFATYYRAYKILANLHVMGALDSEDLKKITKQAARPNGSFNVSKFARIADDLERIYLDAYSEEVRTRGDQQCES